MDIVYMIVGLVLSLSVLAIVASMLLFDRVIEYRRVRNDEDCCDCQEGS